MHCLCFVWPARISAHDPRPRLYLIISLALHTKTIHLNSFPLVHSGFWRTFFSVSRTTPDTVCHTFYFPAFTTGVMDIPFILKELAIIWLIFQSAWIRLAFSGPHKIYHYSVRHYAWGQRTFCTRVRTSGEIQCCPCDNVGTFSKIKAQIDEYMQTFKKLLQALKP